MSHALTIAAAGFGLACLVVIPADGPAAFLRESILEPGWRLARALVRSKLLWRWPRQGPHDCLLCCTPYAAAVCWVVAFIAPSAIGELVLAVCASAGMAGAALLLLGYAQAVIKRAEVRTNFQRRRGVGCSSCARRRADKAAQAAVDGASTTAQ